MSWSSRGAMGLMLVGAVMLTTACASSGSRAAQGPDRMLGWSVELGKGTVSSYARLEPDGAPSAIGVVFSAGALEGLPGGSDRHHCFDRNEDGTLDEHTECLHSHEYVIPLPDAVARRAAG